MQPTLSRVFGTPAASLMLLLQLSTVRGGLITTFTNPTPASGDQFGLSVTGVGSDKVLIGVPYDDAGASDAGVAYLFSTNGTLLTTFTNPTPEAVDVFGLAATAVGTDRVLIGAPDDNTVAWLAGAAYLFSTNGTPLTVFTNPTPLDYEHFGMSIAAVGTDRVLVGAPWHEEAGQWAAGAAYLFNTNGTLLRTMTSPTLVEGQFFGMSVAAVGTEQLLIGEPEEDGGWRSAGAAHLFDTDGTLLTTFTNPGLEGSYAFGEAVAAAGTNWVLISTVGDHTGA